MTTKQPCDPHPQECLIQRLHYWIKQTVSLTKKGLKLLDMCSCSFIVVDIALCISIISSNVYFHPRYPIHQGSGPKSSVDWSWYPLIPEPSQFDSMHANPWCPIHCSGCSWYIPSESELWYTVFSHQIPNTIIASTPVYIHHLSC